MTRTPRIAYLIPDPGIPLGGTKGASVHVHEVAVALASQGAQVTVIAQRVTSPLPGVEVLELDPGPLPRGPEGERARIAAAADFASRAAPLLAALCPDLVLERLSLFFGDGGRLAAGARARRLVEVNAPVAAERATHFGLVHRELADRCERAALATADVLAVSEPVARWAQARTAGSVAVVPNGVDGARFDPGRYRTEAAWRRAALGLEGAEVVGFVGSLKPWHGVDVLLRAVARLAPARPALRVLVVGDGPERARLDGLAAQPALAGLVTFTGAVPVGDVPLHLGMADVVAAPFLPSDHFYFSPLKVVEAMAAGRPVVASDFEPIAAMLGGTGVLVPPGDVGALARGLDRLLADPLEAARLGLAARRRALAVHGWERVAAVVLHAATAEPAALVGPS
jgi:glycosyltransferase involved in cell wall biosynthesis